MNKFDQFVKHRIGARFYIRYADDFILLSEDRGWLEKKVPLIRDYLQNKLRLTLHPEKFFIRTLSSGIDFLGWVHFPDHWVLRTSTKRRMAKRVNCDPSPDTIASYLGLLRHGNTHRIKKKYFGVTDS